jgi:anti-anti-sigma factor
MMNITISQAEGRVPVTILHIHGELDGASHRSLITKGQEVYDKGERDILLDLSDMPYMSSSGLVALHSIALLVRGEKPTDSESGWDAFHAIGRDLDSGLQKHVKLLNPHPQVDKVLGKVGFKQFFEIFDELDAAVASF